MGAKKRASLSPEVQRSTGCQGVRGWGGGRSRATTRRWLRLAAPRSHRYTRPSLPKNISDLADYQCRAFKKILGPRQIRLNAVQIEFAQPPKSTTKSPHTANYSAGLWHDVSFKGLSTSVHSTAFTANGMSKWRGPICLEGRGTTTSLFSYSHPIQPSIN